MKIQFTVNKIILIASVVALASIVYFFIWMNRDIEISNAEINVSPTPRAGAYVNNSLTGEFCPNRGRRPVAVMLPGDAVDRPLSSISLADIVVEMPVNSKGVTRMMTIFQCEEPTEIGSIRSARDDFLPIAASFNSIYAHWGGEKEALDKLNSGLLDNVDGLIYEGTTYYRVPGIKPPHNGFTTYARLIENAINAGYSFRYTFVGYPRQEGKPTNNLSTLVNSININYEPPFQVSWTYDAPSNVYMRIRDNKPEVDKLNNKQVRASVIAVLETTATPFEDGQYLKIETVGQGRVTIYQNGTMIKGTWKKNPADMSSKLFFLDSDGQEIKFTSGKIWVHYITSS
ncbi:MAG: DUF3048 domain-containing protein [Candidatus Yanofskybacteria bacterium]|nr:DUF3048 domain-containing protein [Candidatus Yanofskybacteria bacterium]